MHILLITLADRSSNTLVRAMPLAQAVSHHYDPDSVLG